MSSPYREVVSSVQPKVSQPSPQPPWNYGAKGGSPSPYRLDVSKSSLNVNRLIVKMLGKISHNLIQRDFDKHPFFTLQISCLKKYISYLCKSGIIKLFSNSDQRAGNRWWWILCPRCPNELAELREGAFRCGGGGDPVYLSQTPTFLNYRQGDDDDNLWARKKIR